MREKKFHFTWLDERRLLLNSFVELKKQLIQQGRYTDCVDKLIIRLVDTPIKKVKNRYI